jgi:hypothetical protein
LLKVEAHQTLLQAELLLEMAAVTVALLERAVTKEVVVAQAQLHKVEAQVSHQSQEHPIEAVAVEVEVIIQE